MASVRNAGRSYTVQQIRIQRYPINARVLRSIEMGMKSRIQMALQRRMPSHHSYYVGLRFSSWKPWNHKNLFPSCLFLFISVNLRLKPRLSAFLGDIQLLLTCIRIYRRLSARLLALLNVYRRLSKSIVIIGVYRRLFIYRRVYRRSSSPMGVYRRLAARLSALGH